MLCTLAGTVLVVVREVRSRAACMGGDERERRAQFSWLYWLPNFIVTFVPSSSLLFLLFLRQPPTPIGRYHHHLPLGINTTQV